MRGAAEAQGAPGTGDGWWGRGDTRMGKECGQDQGWAASRNNAACKGTHTSGFGPAVAATVMHSIHGTQLGRASKGPFLLGWLEKNIKTRKLNLIYIGKWPSVCACI